VNKKNHISKQTDVAIKTTVDRYWLDLWNKVNQRKSAKWSFRIIYILLFIGIFSDFIANERPLICKVENKIYYPIFHEYLEKTGISNPYQMLQKKDWNELDYEFYLNPPIPYSSNSFDLKNVYKGPFSTQEIKSTRYRHWLGTSDLGKDVLAGLIHGTRIALLVGILSMLIAGIIGVFFGVLAGYFGDKLFKISRIRVVFNIIGLFLFIIYGFLFRKLAFLQGDFILEIIKSLAIGIFIMAFMNLMAFIIEKNQFFRKKVSLPMDLLLSRILEIINSIPLILILFASLSVIKHPSILNVILIIGFFRWTGISRYLRAELLKIRNLEYIISAKAMGLKHFRIIMKHALPNAISPILIIIAFGISGAILVEATLSFLGIGVGVDDMTWGQLLSFARKKPDAWWLAVFPGIAIFITVTVFNLIGDALSDVLRFDS